MLLLTRSIFLLITRASACVIFSDHIISQPRVRILVFFQFLFLSRFLSVSVFLLHISMPSFLSEGFVHRSRHTRLCLHQVVQTHRYPCITTGYQPASVQVVFPTMPENKKNLLMFFLGTTFNILKCECMSMSVQVMGLSF